MSNKTYLYSRNYWPRIYRVIWYVYVIIAKVTGEDYDAAPLGIAVKKGNTELLGKINDGLAKIKANGKYAEIYKKWFGKEPPVEDLK